MEFSSHHYLWSVTWLSPSLDDNKVVGMVSSDREFGYMNQSLIDSLEMLDAVKEDPHTELKAPWTFARLLVSSAAEVLFSWSRQHKPHTIGQCPRSTSIIRQCQLPNSGSWLLKLSESRCRLWAYQVYCHTSVDGVITLFMSYVPLERRAKAGVHLPSADGVI